MKHEEMIAVITAHKEGKKIQFSLKGENDWDLAISPVWNFADFDYQVEPEPKYRPYANADECFADVKKHGGWVRKSNLEDITEYHQVTSVEPKTVTFSGDFLYYDEFVRHIVWADDGTPCGILEE